MLAHPTGNTRVTRDRKPGREVELGRAARAFPARRSPARGEARERTEPPQDVGFGQAETLPPAWGRGVAYRRSGDRSLSTQAQVRYLRTGKGVHTPSRRLRRVWCKGVRGRGARPRRCHGEETAVVRVCPTGVKPMILSVGAAAIGWPV